MRAHKKWRRKLNVRVYVHMCVCVNICSCVKVADVCVCASVRLSVCLSVCPTVYFAVRACGNYGNVPAEIPARSSSLCPCFSLPLPLANCLPLGLSV